MDKKAKFTLNKIGVFYSVFGAVTVAIQTIIAYYLVNNHREFVIKNNVLLSVLIAMGVTDVLGVIIVYLLTKKMPKWENPRQKLSVLEFLKYYSMVPMVVTIGGLLGSAIQKALFGKTGNAAGDIVASGSNRIMVIIAVGVFAPIFEELIFRKILIDHLAHRGKLLAILVSGLTFGLFHGNFSQFFFAAGLGVLFAYIYVKTGNVLYTIAYHFINNMGSAIVSNLGVNAMNAYAAYLLIVAVVGLIVFAVSVASGKFKLNEIEQNGTIVGKKAVAALFTSYGMILFYIVCIVMFYKTYS